MKQHITLDQLNELSEEEKKKLSDWNLNWNPDNEVMMTWVKCGDNLCLPLLSIGQMIEFIGNRRVYPDLDSLLGDYLVCNEDYEHHNVEEWCDILWEAVKELLKELL
jgi:hypothetical protein